MRRDDLIDSMDCYLFQVLSGAALSQWLNGMFIHRGTKSSQSVSIVNNNNPRCSCWDLHREMMDVPGLYVGINGTE